MSSPCMPWMSSHGLGLNPVPLNRLHPQFSMKNEKFIDSLLLERLICHRNDDFDDSSFSEPTYIYATRFCRLPGSEDLLALANEDGKVIVQDTAISGSDSILTHFQAHNNAIFDVAWLPGSRSQVVTVSGDQSAKLWDFENASTASVVQELRVFRGYSRSVKCVEFVPDDPNVFATGSRENAIFIWDIREPSDSKSANVIRNAHTVQSATSAMPKPAKRRRESLASTSSSPGTPSNSSVTAIQFQDPFTLISSSDSDGIIKVWDMRKSYDRYSRQPQPKYQFAYPGKSALKGYSALVLNATKTHLFASCKDHTIYKFDVAGYSEKPVAMYTGFENNSKYFSRLSLSPDGRYLVSGSSDNCARIWNVGPHGPTEPIARLEGHEAEVTCVEWCSKDLRLVTCGDDMKHRTWRTVGQKSIIDKNDIVGQTILNTDVEYFSPPFYASTLRTEPSLVVEDKKLSLVKRRIFDTDENNRNVENQLASIRISNRQAGTEPATSTSNSSSQSSFPCSPCKMFVSPRKRLNPVTNASPRKLVFSPRKLAIFNSPTSHLPNFVLDEPTSSPQSASKMSARKRQRLDWLTTLSRQKKQQPEMKKSLDPSVKPSESSPKTVRVKRKLDKTCF